ncbi:helix-turn-helix transcriptional regulator [Marinilactibacillus sp. Marseille-P9653]|uniref:helix-turn-helix domain-containing protein n=1 Tax=Marinilactibacillus sp. Marseille-P9653 TaxID=2866583 RepID=UPI001CE447C5|nr:helix-turn-helix transcriptional regulator [Marinilactibacillus sp. Marseille-P9653]
MSIEDQDYIMRQVQLLAKGIGKFLDIFSIKQILMLEHGIEDQITDREIETIVYMTRLEEIQTSKNLTTEELSHETGVDPTTLAKLYSNERSASEEELEKLIEYVENEQIWIS